MEPSKLAAVQADFQEQITALLAMGPQATGISGDRRFADAAWAHNPLASHAAAAHLIQTRALSGMVDAVQADAKTVARLRFAVEQWAAAGAPSNFLAFNAKAQKLAIETQGQSIAKGIQNLIHDLGQGHVSMTDESVFTVGQNVATTEGAVVFENDLFQLLEYKPLTAQVYEKPFLLKINVTLKNLSEASLLHPPIKPSWQMPETWHGIWVAMSSYCKVKTLIACTHLCNVKPFSIWAMAFMRSCLEKFIKSVALT
jgi:hypothetical protein